MAQLNPQRLKQVIVDGETVLAPETARVSDLVPRDVAAITVIDDWGKSRLLPKEQWTSNRPLPAGITTHLTNVLKGGF